MKRITLLLLLSFQFFQLKSQKKTDDNYLPFFNAAYLNYPNIPKGMLEAVSFSNTRMQHIQHTSTKSESCSGIPNAYGVMGLTLNGENYFRNNLVFVSNLSNYSFEEIISSPEKNILAYATAYDSIKKKLKITSNEIEAQLPILAQLSELPDENTAQNYALNLQLYSYYDFLNSPKYQEEFKFPKYQVNFTSLFGADNYSILNAPSVTISDESIYNTKGSIYQNNTIQSADYGPAIWNAAASCNYSSRNGTAISAVTIHTVQGTYASCIAWFKNCAARASAHYVIRSSDGQVTQMVSEAEKAWHVRAESIYAIGIEHEGYINYAPWYTNNMYVSSANLVKDITSSGYGISPLRTYYGTGCSGSTADCGLGPCTKIKGHQMFPNQTHNDPGPNWNWSLYYNLINNNPTINTITNAAGIFTDNGGSNANYSDDQRTLTLIKPSGATAITINFSAFNLEQNYDYLFIYDGATNTAPLIGAYTGTDNPGTITSNGNALLFEFRSDCAVNSQGWLADWTSTITSPTSSDSIAPTTNASTPNGWETTNFTTTYTDADNIGGSGLEQSYYQVINFNGTEWRANSNNGFFADNFDFAVHPDWVNIAGNWSSTSASLLQSDEAQVNANIYTNLNQNLSNRYLYNFHAKINGSGTNRRAGFHFFSDNGSTTNRGNSYLVWFKIDEAKLQIFKVINDVLGAPVVDMSYTTIAGQWYDYKIIFDKNTGKISIYSNNSLITSWIDANPFPSGNVISFRTGNANFAINELKVYRSRNATNTNVSVGAAATNDIRYQNPNPTTFSAKVKSICADSAGNLSAIYYKNINVDWTPPTTVTTINDGTGADIAATNSLTELSANWLPAIDQHSSIARYWYAIGTTPGATNVVNWTDNWIDTAVTVSGLSLVVGQTYYFSIKSENGAGLLSIATNSNGQKVDLSIDVEENNTINTINVFPNPFTNYTSISYELKEKSVVDITLLDVLGKKINLLNTTNQNTGKHIIEIKSDELKLSKGMYFLSFAINDNLKTIKIIMK